MYYTVLSLKPTKLQIIIVTFLFCCFWTSEFGRVFLKSAVSFTYLALSFYFFILRHSKFRLFLQGFQIQKKHRYGRVKTYRYVPANIYFCSFFSLLPTLFDKHSGCYGNSLTDVAEKPKILKRFWQRRSGVIQNGQPPPQALRFSHGFA